MTHVMKLSSLTDELITVLTGFSVEVGISSTTILQVLQSFSVTDT